MAVCIVDSTQLNCTFCVYYAVVTSREYLLVTSVTAGQINILMYSVYFQWVVFWKILVITSTASSLCGRHADIRNNNRSLKFNFVGLKNDQPCVVS